jgi:hypothetical protein
MRLELGQKLEDGTVAILRIGVQGRPQRRGKRLHARREICDVIREVAVRLEVERVLGLRRLGTQQERVLMAQRVPDAELVERVGIVDRHVGDDEIRGHEQPEHVLADVALPDELSGGAALDGNLVLVAQPHERGPYERPLDFVEVDSLFRAKRADKKGAHAVPSLHLLHDNPRLVPEAQRASRTGRARRKLALPCASAAR